jgi:hypothetical protein
MTPNAPDVGSQDPSACFICLKIKSNPSRRVVMGIFSKSGIFDRDSSERQSNIKSSDYGSIKNLKT